jgi:hypothetical protein
MVATRGEMSGRASRRSGVLAYRPSRPPENAVRPAPARAAGKRGISGAEAPGCGVAVLLKIYAHCIDGQADASNQRITEALGIQDNQPESESDNEGDDNSEQAS